MPNSPRRGRALAPTLADRLIHFDRVSQERSDRPDQNRHPERRDSDYATAGDRRLLYLRTRPIMCAPIAAGQTGSDLARKAG